MRSNFNTTILNEAISLITAIKFSKLLKTSAMAFSSCFSNTFFECKTFQLKKCANNFFVGKKGKYILLAGLSRKSKKVKKTTLTAETLALNQGVSF